MKSSSVLQVGAGSRTELGVTGIKVSPIGAGTWQWGARFYWGYGRDYGTKELSEAFVACLERGVNWFDTAELYGRGLSEKILGTFVTSRDHESATKGPSLARPIIATKFFPYPWRWHRSSLRRAVLASLRRLKAESIDLYQIHFPLPPRGSGYWVDALGDLAQDGLVKSVGVSNFSADQTKRAHETLGRRGVILASNQVGYSLLNRSAESNGVLETCRELNVSVIAYGPLAEGLLTGKYLPGSPPPFFRRMRWARNHLHSLPPLISLMNDIASKYDATPSQVALNWLVRNGVLPIPGIKSATQATDNAASMNWDLSDDEFAILSDAT